MGMLGKGVGVLAKNSGSLTPSFVIQDQPDPEPQQFEVGAHKVGEEWYLSITQGYCERVASYSAIVSTGNRDVLVGSQGIASPGDLGELTLHKVNEVGAHKGLRYPNVLNKLDLGQQYLAPEEYTYVFLYIAYPGDGVKLAVVGKDVYNSHFNFAGSAPDRWGMTAVIQIAQNTEINTTTSGGYVTSVTVNNSYLSYWERLGLMVRPLATFRRSTGQITVHNVGPQTFDYVSETYGKIGDEAPEIVDGNWSAYYYKTGAPNAPSGYTFTEGPYSV